ncbi:MAG: ABC transporter permease subunit [Planctomycetota bacterium]
MKQIKHFLLKIVDLTALGFLEPYVRLAYWEEPRKQLKKIGQFTLIPVLALVVAVALWGFLAPRHTTKYGSVPTPENTWNAWQSIMTFHNQYQDKTDAYLLEGEQRLEAIKVAEARGEDLVPLVEAAQDELARVKALVLEEKTAETAEMTARLEAMKDERRTTKREKEAEFKERALALADGDTVARDQLKADYREMIDWEEEQKDLASDLNSEIKIIMSRKDAREDAALLNQTLLMDEAAHMRALLAILTKDGREVRVQDVMEKLAELEAAYAAPASSKTFTTLRNIVRSENRLEKAKEAENAMTWTLPMQITRSILCVFTGFFIGVAVAVPIGVLCGLSTTFMGAMTPFIALFKPVSPIVWLLIFWIIVGGFFPDPDKSVVLTGLTDTTDWLMGWVPFVGGMVRTYDINIAFIASALTVSMCSLWATLVNTALGVASVDKDHINVARVLRLGFFSRLFKIILPSALPLVFAGMRISLGVGWMVLIAAELLASSEGVGKFTWDMFNNGATDSFAKIVCMVFVVGAIGLVLDRIMIIFQRLVSFEGSVAAV